MTIDMTSITTAELLLRIPAALLMLSFGINQMWKPYYWVEEIPPIIKDNLPTKPESFMRVHSLGNIALGVLLLSGLWLYIITWLSALWLTSIVLAIFINKNWTVAMRDLCVAASLFALIILENLYS
jgi:hypothetical protein